MHGKNPPEIDESALLESLRSGDERAFEAAVRLFSGRLYAVALRFLKTEEDARDAVQDAFLSAWRSLDRFEGGARLSTWLHRIVVNAALMKLRTRRRKPEESIEDYLPRFLEDGHAAEPPVLWQDSAIEALSRAETRRIVREGIDRLPESYRTVLLLRDIEGYDTEDTARLLETTANAVKVRLHRARQALRTVLDPHFRKDAG
jgi:RNA polymerase sigma-70 factor (ECF subfamily)